VSTARAIGECLEWITCGFDFKFGGQAQAQLLNPIARRGSCHCATVGETVILLLLWVDNDLAGTTNGVQLLFVHQIMCATSPLSVMPH